MDGTTVLWIVLAVVVVLILIAIMAAAMRRTKQRRIEHDREQARTLQQEAQTASARAEKQQAAADEVEARSRRAQAIADEKAAEARRLAAGAAERRQVVEETRSEVDARLSRADALDPDRREQSLDGRDADPGAAREVDERAATDSAQHTATTRETDGRGEGVDDRSEGWAVDGRSDGRQGDVRPG